MKTLTKAAAGLGSAGVVGTAAAGTWYVSSSSSPSPELEVKRRIITVGTSPRAWRAVFLTHKDDQEFISFTGVLATESDKVAGPRVMAACEKAIKEADAAENYEDAIQKAKKYCTTPELKTVEATVLFSDKEVSSSEQDFRNAFNAHKNNSDFIDKVQEANPDTQGFDSNAGLDTAQGLVRKFCDELKVKSPEIKNVSVYEQFCLQISQS